MRQSAHLLIDGDIYLYKASVSSEKVINFDGDNCFMLGSLSESKEIFANEIATFLETFNTSQYTIALSDKENFRKEILPSYKANRKNKPKPLVYHCLRQWVEEEYNTISRPKLEGDDILGILATSKSIIKNQNRIIISVDKDMKTIPAKFYDSLKEERKVITVKEANYNHMLQTLIGDSADGYGGCKGIGVVSAQDIIYQGMSYKDMWANVVLAFRKKGFTEQDALVQARMARILRDYDYDLKNKKIKLWSIESELEG